MSDDYYTTPDGRPGITVRPQGDDDDDVEGLRRLLTLTPDLSRGSGIELLDKLIGAGGKQRFQTWPERMVRSAVTLPGQVASGEVPTYLPSVSDDPSRADFAGNAVGGRIMNPEITQRVQDLAGMAGGASLPMAERGAVGMAGGKLIQPAKQAPVFYSGVERAIEQAPQAKMTPQQWSGYLRNQPGVKAEELQWLGLDDHTAWPGELNKGAVTKDQLLEHAEGHGVKIKEIEKKSGPAEGDHEDNLHDAALEEAQAYFDSTPRLQRIHNGDIDSWLSTEAGQRFYDSALAGQNEWHGGVNGGTKFSDYQLPGGDNYRELLLTLPEKPRPKEATWWTPDSPSHPPNFGGRFNSKEDAQWFMEKHGIEGEPVAGPPMESGEQLNFHSSHWDEPNVLAHVRMNDRTLPGPKTERLRELENKIPVKDDDPPLTPNDASEYAALVHDPDAAGLKSLHLEEIQSDWHQAGRKKGYHTGTDPAKLEEAQAKLDDAMEKTRSYFAKKWEGDQMTQHEIDKAIADIRSERIPTQLLGSPNEHLATDAIDAMRARNDLMIGNRVPDAPFKQSWPDLALKRAVAKAAREGYDAVSWTPGEQQAARYDLSKHLDELQYSPQSHHLIGVKNGNKVIDNLNVEPDKLPDYVGKDAAEKLLKSEATNEKVGGTYHILSGLDLKVGGEGMKAFYDKMLVDKANALGKKFGTKVEWKELPGQQGQIVERHFPAGGQYRSLHHILDRSGISVGEFETLAQAEAALAKMPGRVKVPVLRLTPGLRDAATKRGFPLFARGLPFTFTPVDHDPFSDKERK